MNVNKIARRRPTPRKERYASYKPKKKPSIFAKFAGVPDPSYTEPGSENLSPSWTCGCGKKSVLETCWNCGGVKPDEERS